MADDTFDFGFTAVDEPDSGTPAPQAPNVNNDEILDKLAELFSTDTRDNWISVLRKADMISTHVNTMLEASNDPNIKENTNVITKKAVGEKCPVCWKIFQEKCERHNCGFEGKKK